MLAFDRGADVEDTLVRAFEFPIPFKHLEEDRFKGFLSTVENKSGFTAFANFFEMDLSTAGGSFFATQLGSGGTRPVVGSTVTPEIR